MASIPKDKNVLPGKLDNDKFTYALVSCIFVACVSSNIFFGPSFCLSSFGTMGIN